MGSLSLSPHPPSLLSLFRSLPHSHTLLLHVCFYCISAVEILRCLIMMWGRYSSSRPSSSTRSPSGSHRRTWSPSSKSPDALDRKYKSRSFDPPRQYRDSSRERRRHRYNSYSKAFRVSFHLSLFFLFHTHLFFSSPLPLFSSPLLLFSSPLHSSSPLLSSFVQRVFLGRVSTFSL